MKNKHFIRIMTALLALLCLLPAAACAEKEVVPTETKERTTEAENTWKPAEGEADAVLLSADYERTRYLTENVLDRPRPETDFTDALNGFSFDFFRACLKAGGNEDGANELISPLSAALCISLVENGASGKTLAEMETMFGMPLEKWRASLGELADLLPSYVNEGKVQTANSIWIKNQFAPFVRPSFLQSNAEYFDAQVYSSPFDLSLPKDVNKWAYDRTDGLIKNLMDENQEPDPDAVMVLLNALLFDMPWADAVEDFAVKEELFTNSDGIGVNVDMLHFSEDFYLKNDKAIGFAKAYADGRYQFVGLLPTGKNTVDDVIASLNAESWKKLLSSLKEADVVCAMPEFTYDGSYDLKTPLKALGMVSAFDQKDADFSAMADWSDDLWVGKAFQKTRIELTRNGTRAAAVTGMVMEAETALPMRREKIEIRLDRPFVYLIINRMTGTPLFIGTVNEM